MTKAPEKVDAEADDGRIVLESERETWEMTFEASENGRLQKALDIGEPQKDKKNPVRIYTLIF